VTEEKRTLRERVSRLESRLDAFLVEKGEVVEARRKSRQVSLLDNQDGVEEDDQEVGGVSNRWAPLVSALEASGVRSGFPYY